MTTMLAQWRRRLEIFSLRWQAHLDTRQVDRAVPWVIALLWAGALSGLSLARAHQLDTGADLSSHLQAVWLIGEGYQPLSSVAGHNLLWEQAAFILYPVAGLTALFPDQPTLLTLQSAALALAVVPLWRIARDLGGLKPGAAAALVFAYCAYPAVHAINLSDFHPEALAVPALFAAVLHALSGRWTRFGLFALIVVVCRADLAFALAGLGLLVLLEGRRRPGTAITLGGLAYGLVSMTAIQPRFNGGKFPHLEAFSTFGTGNPGSVLWGLISAPHEAVADTMSQANFQMIVFLLAPVMLLPLVVPRYVLPVVPLFAVYLVADVPTGQLAEAPQTVPVTVFIFVATVFALARTGRVLVERVNVDRRLLTVLALTATIFFLRDAPSSLYQKPWDWGRHDTMDMARQEAAELIPPDAAVRASDRVLPLLSDRTRLYRLSTAGSPDRAAVEAAPDVEWIVFDMTAAPEWSELNVERFDLDIRRSGFERTDLDNGGSALRLYRRLGVIRS